MDLEEIKNLSDEDLGKAICEQMPYYDVQQDNLGWIVYRQNHVGKVFCSEFCSILDLIAEVEKEVTGKYGNEYYNALRLTAEPQYIYEAITASARHRAEACLIVLQS